MEISCQINIRFGVSDTEIIRNTRKQANTCVLTSVQHSDTYIDFHTLSTDLNVYGELHPHVLLFVTGLQMASRMEEIRALLQSMNNQQQQQHQHTHSHFSPSDSPPQGDHTHSHTHGHSHGAEPGGEGPGGAAPLDVRAVVRLLQTSGVFFILLLLRFVYDHYLGKAIDFCRIDGFSIQKQTNPVCI